MKLIFLLFLISFLTISSSCGIFKPPPIAYHCPEIILPNDPIPETNKLTDKSKPDEITKAWVYTAVSYRDWNRIVRKQIKNSR